MRKVTAILLAAVITAGLPAVAAAQRGDRDGQQGERHRDQGNTGGQPDRGNWQRPDNGGARPDFQRPQGQERPQWQGQGNPGRGPDQRPEQRQPDQQRWQGQQPQQQQQFQPQPGQPPRDNNWSRGQDRGDQRRDFNPGDRGRRGDDRPDFGRPGNRGDDRRPDFRPDNGRDFRPGDRRPDFRPDQNWRGRPEAGRPDFRPDFRDGRGGGGFDRGWRQDRRYDWRGYRNSNRNLFRGPRYIAPRNWGYGYRRFDIGVRLPNFFFAQQYWLADPWEYRLPPAYGPYRWVRYYNDVLLVDLTTGMVVDSIPDFFF